MSSNKADQFSLQKYNKGYWSDEQVKASIFLEQKFTTKKFKLAGNPLTLNVNSMEIIYFREAELCSVK